MAAAALLVLLTIAHPARFGPGHAQGAGFRGLLVTEFDTPSFGFANTTGMNGYTFSPAFNFFRGFGVVGKLSGQYTKNVNLRDIAVGPQFLIRAAMRSFWTCPLRRRPQP